MTVAPSDLDHDYQALRHGLGAVWVERDVVRVAGPDAVGYLQGQLSQDVAALCVGASAPTLLLSPQGKVDAWLRATRVAEDAYLLDVDRGWGETVVARLGRFKLRSKLEMGALEGWRCLALRGPGTAALAGAGEGAGLSAGPGEGAGQGAGPGEGAGLSAGPGEGVGAARRTGEGAVLAVPAFWPGVLGVDLLGESVSIPAGAALCGSDALTTLRVEAGVPAMGSELGERTIPAEAGLVEASVSFTKGCYTGQELVARLDSRGNRVPRRLRGVIVAWDVLESSGQAAGPPVGAELVNGDKVVGELTTVASSPGLRALVALAYVRREVVPPTELILRWEGGSVPAQVRDLPLVSVAS